MTGRNLFTSIGRTV